MPQALQGIDMVFYSILHSLGLKPEVRPLLDISTIGDLIDDIYDEYGDSYKYDKELYKRQPLLFAELLGFDREEAKRSRKFPDFMSQEEWKEKRRNVSHVGKGFHSLKFCETGDGECSTRFSFEEHAAVCSSSILPPYTKRQY